MNTTMVRETVRTQNLQRFTSRVIVNTPFFDSVREELHDLELDLFWIMSHPEICATVEETNAKQIARIDALSERIAELKDVLKIEKL